MTWRAGPTWSKSPCAVSAAKSKKSLPTRNSSSPCTPSATNLSAHHNQPNHDPHRTRLRHRTGQRPSHRRSGWRRPQGLRRRSRRPDRRRWRAIFLHTYLQVREDALNLYGFASEDELGIFELLLGVSGVGPKVALATLGVMTPESLRAAVAERRTGPDRARPRHRQAHRRKDRAGIARQDQRPRRRSAGLAQTTDIDTEVVEALISLGYSVVEAQRAVQKLPKDAVGVADRLRTALSQFT